MSRAELEFLAGNVAYAVGHPLWQSLLQADLGFSNDPASVQEISALAKHIVTHNSATGNFRSLLQTVVNLIRTTRENGPASTTSVTPLHNGLLLVRLLMYRFLRVLSTSEILLIIQGPKPATGGDWSPKLLLTELLTGAIYLKPSQGVMVYKELLHFVLVLLSTQIYCPNETNSLIMNAQTQDFSGLAGALVTVLLQNATLDLLDKAFTPSGLLSYIFGSTNKRPEVADLSMLLLALLVNQEWKKDPNPFREAMKNLKNKAPENPVSLSHSPCCPFDRLYQLLSLTVAAPQGSLLLYVFVLENKSFKEFMFSHAEPQKLLLPALQFLYESLTIPIPGEKVPEKPLESKLADCHIYLLLICLLILTGDIEYCRRLNTIEVRSISWFKDQTLLAVPLSSLAALVLIRAIQSNLRGLRDPFLHTNCFGCLANMSNHFYGLHQYAAQRLVFLLQLVGKKYLSLQKKISDESPRSSLSTPQTPQTPDRIEQLDVAHLISDLDDQSHIVIYSDLIMLVLEIINAILSKNLAGNPNLVYSLLHEQSFFAHFRTPPKFSALIENIETVVAHFKTRLADANLEGGYEEIRRFIERESQKWPRSKLRELHEIGYTYEEEKNVKEFFYPFVWGIISAYPLMSWSVDTLPIFTEFLA